MEDLLEDTTRWQKGRYRTRERERDSEREEREERDGSESVFKYAGLRFQPPKPRARKRREERGLKREENAGKTKRGRVF
ncbi:hypothetical protein TRV_04022 [Trichophyton verrucosum HKI 0517]|uniref:Uncharacterized protein n=1 Tax=Trichophyton verrucosum (strain HKI 0517) TaxID=663202 RepID=D4DA76_TRIVH|nr:uncharacterized protein TRV_04022 [Trichophyton verrucosum HKI 0517]EFE41227.1 hypothetical protein TRV_04022 [Trichophyton verrucosum HKI 0517]